MFYWNRLMGLIFVMISTWTSNLSKVSLFLLIAFWIRGMYGAKSMVSFSAMLVINSRI